MNRISFVFAVAAFALLGLYVAEYTGFFPSWLLWPLTGFWVILGAVLVIAPDLFYGGSVETETIVLPWDEVIRVVSSEPGAGFLIAALGQLVLIVYIVTAAVRQFRHGDRSRAIVLAVGVGWFIIALGLENLSSLGVLDLPPAADFGFLGFLLALSFAMVNESIETEEQLFAYQRNLERMVSDRTRELEAAQDRIVDQAEESAVAAERIRISRDLHDAVSQLLFSINLLAGSLPRQWETDPTAAERSTVELQRLSRGALAEMRTLLRELRPNTIPQTDLEILIRQVTEGTAARIDVPVDVSYDVVGTLPPEVHVAVYRICQEAIANVAKHADPNRVEVTVAGTSERIHLSVRDDGNGFAVSELPSGTMGLTTMNERAEEIGGHMAVTSADLTGTVVSFDWETDSV
ncbi:MAG: histidine kinase [Acidimicrobiia bacterium]